jgi:hypothetical protein
MTDDTAARLDLIEDWEAREVEPQRFGEWYAHDDDRLVLRTTDSARIVSDTAVPIRR